MHRALAVGSLADHGRAVMVLKCAGENFAGTGAIVVHQKIHRHSPAGPPLARRPGFAPGSAAGRNDHALVDEPFGDLDGHIEQPARIAAEVEDQCPHPQAWRPEMA